MNILLISYLFPPEVNPQSIMSARFAKYLQRAGHHVTVLAGSNVELYNSSHGSDKLFINDFKEIDIQFISDKKFTGLITSMKNKIIYHENYRHWVKKLLLTALPLCKKYKFDIIYSLGAPLASNMAGLSLKFHTGIPWVAHFSDPTMTAFNKRFKSPIRTYLTYRDEKMIFNKANGITFVNNETLTKCTEFKLSYRNKCYVIPHCYDAEYFSERITSHRRNNVINFTYVGALYSRRNPFDVIKAINIITRKMGVGENKIQFNLYGAIEPAIYSQLIDSAFPWVKIYGPVNYKDSINAMIQSDYLVLIDMPDDINLFTPSKLIDYLAALKPIIGITSKTSNSAKLLERIGYPVVEPNDPERIAQLIYSIIKEDRLSITNQHLQSLKDYNAENVVSQLLSVFDSVVKAARK